MAAKFRIVLIASAALGMDVLVAAAAAQPCDPETDVGRALMESTV